MQISQTRWNNARLIHLFIGGNRPYSFIANRMDKNVGLVMRWFFKGGFKKAIGHQVAREIETIFGAYIVQHTGMIHYDGWMDATHYDLWRELLAVDAEGQDDEPIATYDAIEKTLLRVLKRGHDSGLVLKDEDFVRQVLRILPIYSADMDIRERAVDKLLLETADQMKAPAKSMKSNKNKKKVARKKVTTKPVPQKS